MDRLVLFETAKALFGKDSLVTASLQNPTTLHTQDDVEEVLRGVNDEINKRQAEYLHFVERTKEFKHRLQETFMNGELA